MAFVVRIAASDQLCQTASLRWNFLPLSLSACVCVYVACYLCCVCGISFSNEFPIIHRIQVENSICLNVSRQNIVAECV